MSYSEYVQMVPLSDKHTHMPQTITYAYLQPVDQEATGVRNVRQRVNFLIMGG